MDAATSFTKKPGPDCHREPGELATSFPLTEKLIIKSQETKVWNYALHAKYPHVIAWVFCKENYCWL